jgi:4-amino-4-deoxychorismate lyase
VESPVYAGSGADDLKLIETMLWDGRGFPRLGLHLARLERSAKALGWALPASVEQALQAVGRDTAARVRLTLGKHGALDVAISDLPPAKAQWTVALSPVRVDSADPWLRLKTTRRALYDGARAALPEGLDELLFLNERGEVCEGTISTLFFDRGDGMRTPPVACGLLPGVLRAELGCPEEVLSGNDLGRVRLWMGNALRGLIAVKWLE